METVSTLIERPILYLYGFVASPAAMPDLPGVEEDAAVVLVQEDGIGCAVSIVSADEYSRERSARDQLAWVTPRAWRHHDVVRRLHATATVVPLKFGTLCGTVEDVRAMLRERRETITTLLSRLSGRDEWTLNVSVDRRGLASWLQACDPVLANLKSAEVGLPAGQAYFARKRVEKATSDAIDQTVAMLRDDLFAFLAPHDLQVLTIDPPSAPADLDRSPVLSAALLLARDGFEPVHGALAAFESQHADARVTCEVVGPWPPYSFAALV